MLKKRFKHILRPGYILSVLFLFFICYVGLAAIPQLLINTGNTLLWHQGYRNYIRQTNEQYSSMLETDTRFPPLQDKGSYIHLNGFMAKLLGQPMMNDRVLMENGHLSHVISSSPEPEEIRQAAENIIRFQNILSASGKHFLFVIAPSQISKYEDFLPEGYTDTTNATADAFLSLLQQEGVAYLDLREELQKDGISVTDAFFSTDHHWKPQTGFWAYGKILEKLARIDAITPPDPYYTNPENYRFITYPDTFLGSSGRRTGRYFAGVDDSVFIQPDFETDISVSVPEREMELKGRYEEVCYNSTMEYDFRNPNFFQENCYGLYGWGDTKITHWRNPRAPVDTKVLLIGESFGNIPFSLMSICLSSCDEMDLRHYDGNFAVYFDDYNPDTVVIEVNTDMILSVFTTFAYLK